ncbi:FliH/SctL family protein [Arenibaculum sp.]|jgi:flagellar assembly protein FliH|uniref:FliH/SctL family protein n=1 Tax=Arenibaculum sp. TaxID=2865862 RepID=UPI002E13203B|nr:FliH/SctL family protein [Arenibaculum sp.]
MSTTRKFLFDTSFDDPTRRREELEPPPPPPPVPEPEPEPAPPPEPTFSREELLRAHEDGYADGFAAGKAAAETAAAQRLADVLAAAEAALLAMLAQAEASAADRRDEAARIAMAIARKLLPTQARRHGLAEVEAMIEDCVAEMIEEPRLVVRVHDEMLDEIAGRIDALTTARGFAGKTIVLADPTLGYGDCRVEWAEGGAEREAERLWRDLDRIAGRLLGGGTAGQAGGGARAHAAAVPPTTMAEG